MKLAEDKTHMLGEHEVLGVPSDVLCFEMLWRAATVVTSKFSGPVIEVGKHDLQICLGSRSQTAPRTITIAVISCQCA